MANNVVREHLNHLVIIVTHAYLNETGSLLVKFGDPGLSDNERRGYLA